MMTMIANLSATVADQQEVIVSQRAQLETEIEMIKQFVGMVPPPSMPPAPSSPWADRLLVDTTLRTWVNARSQCEATGGRLVEIYSAEQNSQAYTAIVNAGISTYGAWIGGADFTTENNFVWVGSGAPISIGQVAAGGAFTNWVGYAPDNHGGGQDCI